MATYKEIIEMDGAAILTKTKDKYEYNHNTDTYHIDQQYDVCWENDVWNDVDFKITRLEVSGCKDGEDSDNNSGYVRVHFTVSTIGTKEVHLHPKEVYAILEDDTEITSSEYVEHIENIFEKGRPRKGHIDFNFLNIAQMKSMKAFYIEFDGHFVGDSDATIEHTYIVPLHL